MITVSIYRLVVHTMRQELTNKLNSLHELEQYSAPQMQGY